MKNVTKIVVIMFVFTACLYDRTAVMTHLGENFYYIGAASESVIISQMSDPRVEGLGGFIVIPAEIVEYNFDSVFIISKTDEWFSDTLKYWILDKSKYLEKMDSNGHVDLKLNKSILFQTDDSMTFINELKARKIEMVLKPRN